MNIEAIIPRLARTKDALASLDNAELFEGYRDGRANDPPPGPNRTDSYVHGWWTGMRDGGHRQAHLIDQEIVRAFLKGPNPASSPNSAGISDSKSHVEPPAPTGGAHSRGGSGG